MLGRGIGGLRGIDVSGSGYNEVRIVGDRCGCLRRMKETCGASCVWISSSSSRCCKIVPDVLACAHMYILYVCVYICVCVYVDMRDNDVYWKTKGKIKNDLQ